MAETVLVRYLDPVKSDYVNRRVSEIRPTGVYMGGVVTWVSVNSVTVGAVLAEIQDATVDESGVRSTNQIKYFNDTSTPVTITGLGSSFYIVLRWTHTADATTDKPEYLALAGTNVKSTDVILCKVINNTIDYAERSMPKTYDSNLKVQPTYNRTTPTPTFDATSVEVLGGYVYKNTSLNTPEEIKFQLVNVSSASTGYVYIKNGGTVSFSSTPTDVLIVLAKITRATTTTEISRNAITDMRSSFSKASVPDGVTLNIIPAGYEGAGKWGIPDSAIITAKVADTNITNAKLAGTSTNYNASGAVGQYKINSTAVDGTTIQVNNSGKLNVASTFKSFGDFTTRDTSNTTFSVETTYYATTDGFIGVTNTGGSTSIYVSKTKASVTGESSAVLRAQLSQYSNTRIKCATLPISAGEYFKVAGDVVQSFWWKPIATGGCIRQS